MPASIAVPTVDVDAVPPASSLPLQAIGVSYRYRPDADDVLRDWSHDFAAGTMTALVGPSGSGKSTLLYTLGLLVRPRSGEIRLDGDRVDHLPDASRAAVRAHRLGFVFQDAALDPSRTVLDNVVESALYRREARQDALDRGRALLERFGVAARADHRPGQISGGQASRIALCRALVADPGVILADEPTGNLDAAASDVVLRALREQADAGAVVVIATHEDAVMDACDTRLQVQDRRT